MRNPTLLLILNFCLLTTYLPAATIQQPAKGSTKAPITTTITKTPTSGTNSNTQTPAVDLTFIQIAKNGTIARNINDRSKFTLTLKGVDPEIVYMSDRSSALSGKTTIQQFLNEWKLNRSNLKPERPNALLVSKMSKTARDNQSNENMVILSNPRYTESTKSLVYDIEIMDKSKTIREGSVHDPVLFIESTCTAFCR